MSKKLKENLIIVIAIVLGVIYIAVPVFESARNQKNSSQLSLETQKMCQQVLDDGTASESLKKICPDIINQKIYDPDFYSVLADVNAFDIKNLIIVISILIFITAAYNCHGYLKQKAITNYLSRESYYKFLKRFFFFFYKSIGIMGGVTLILLVLCIANTTTDPSFSLEQAGLVTWPSELLKQPILFCGLYLLNTILHAIFYVNLYLIVVRYVPSFFKSIILSFIFLIGGEIFIEGILSDVILQGIFGIEYNTLLNVMNVFRFNTTYGIGPLFLSVGGVAAISSIVVFLVYKDKEKLIFTCDKNGGRE